MISCMEVQSAHLHKAWYAAYAQARLLLLLLLLLLCTRRHLLRTAVHCLVLLTSEVLLCINFILASKVLPVLLELIRILYELISFGLARSEQQC